MIYRINKKKLRPLIIKNFVTVKKFVEIGLGFSLMRWSQITRTNYKTEGAPVFEKIERALNMKREEFLDKLEIGE